MCSFEICRFFRNEIKFKGFVEATPERLGVGPEDSSDGRATQDVCHILWFARVADHHSAACRVISE